MVQSRRARHLQRARISLPLSDLAEQSSSAASNTQSRKVGLGKLHHEFGIIQEQLGRQQHLLSQQNELLSHMQNQWDSLQRHELSDQGPSSSASNIDASLERVQQQFGLRQQRPHTPELQRNRVQQPQSTPPPYHYTSPPVYLTTPRLPAYRSAAPTPELKPRVRRTSFDRRKTPEQRAPQTPATAQFSLPDRSTPRTEHRSQTRTTREEHLATPTRRRIPTASTRARSRPPAFTIVRAEELQPRQECEAEQETVAGQEAQQQDSLDTVLAAWASEDEDEDEADDADQEREILAQTAESNIFYYNQQFPRSNFKPTANCARLPLDKDVDIRFMFGRMDRKCEHCGSLNWVEERQKRTGSTRAFPTFPCCASGQVELPQPTPMPPGLFKLLSETFTTRTGATGRTQLCVTFHKIIRHINNAFSFCSLGTTHPKGNYQNATTGAYTFASKGQLYHNIGSLQPDTGQKPVFAQLYIFDGDDQQGAVSAQQQARSDAFTDIPLEIMTRVHNLIQVHHPYVRAFKMNAHRIRENPTLHLQLNIVDDQGHDPRRYNKPTASEVAVILPDISAVTQGRSIVLENTAGGRSFINEYKPQYLPLRYPLLYIFGEQGWSKDIPLKSQPLPQRQQNGGAPSGARDPPPVQDEDKQEQEPEEEDLDENGEPVQRRRGRGKHGSTRVSQRQWYDWHLRPRDIITALMLGGRLLHEWIVDAFAATEANRLNYVRRNQAELRTAKYSGMMDALRDNEGAETGDIGVPVILPATHMGSPRQMRAAYHDAMAIVRHFGSPDYFITMTCNPRWREITRELLPGQLPQDVPHLQNRVFKIMLDQLLHELTVVGVLGRAVANCYTIEFQKRGLPHAHILLIMHPESRLKTGDEVDAAIRADLPKQAEEPLLHDVVTRFMVHSKCGDNNQKASCMRDKKCRFRFPRALAEETVLSENGYPTHRCLDDSNVFRKGNDPYEYTNRDIAPYNEYLSLRFNCHINVQFVAGFASVKYMYKYVFKGGDRAMLRVGADGIQRVDEVQDFIDARYVAAHEAHWRITSFKTHNRSPNVIALAMHLENQQTVNLPAGESVANVATREKSLRSTLTEYFAINRKFKEDVAHGLIPAFDPTVTTYQNFPSNFTWSKAAKAWKPRSKGFALGRINWVPLTSGEVHYLRMLLTERGGQAGWEDARTINGVIYPTYRAACMALGLLLDDLEYEQALEEATVAQLGHQLRELFATILVHCSPADPLKLWDKFKVMLSDDCEYALRHRFDVRNPTQQDAFDLALCYLRICLQRQNKSLEDYQLPLPQRDFMQQISTESNRLLRAARDYDVNAERIFANDAFARMNTDQRTAFRRLNVAVTLGQGGVFFIDGPGGTGKTFLQKGLLAKIRSQGKVALAVASSGIAATLLPGGTTAHSRFKIPIPISEGDSCRIDKSSHLAEMLRNTELVFWDEAVMFHKHGMEAVDKSMRDIRGNDLPFGGTVFCFCGDFRQTLPVMPGGTRAQVVNACLKRSRLWRHTTRLRLQQNMRLERPGMDEIERTQIQAFAQRLLDIGERTGQDETIQWPITDIVAGNNVATLANELYPGIKQHVLSPGFLRSRAILAGRNDTTRAINEALLAEMAGREFCSISVDTPKESDTGAMFPPELLNSTEQSGLPPHKLRLKIGCTVILLRNLDAERGLCNGTRLYVTKMERRLLTCTILGGDHFGETVQLPRMPLASPHSHDGLEFTRHQWPVKLAFAMTINKSQGQSLDHVGLVLDPEVFGHGQLYVALSRVTSASGIRIVVPPTERATASGHLKNIVYSEVFRED